MLGSLLSGVKNTLRWWIGDWCSYGEHHYGATYAAALAETGYDYKTLANAKYVAGRFEFSRRRENLSWSHHAEVAALESAEADAWLDRAVAKHWSQRTLRAQMKAARACLEGGSTVATITEPPTMESDLESSEIESPKTEEPDNNQDAGAAPRVGEGGNAADDQWRVGVKHTIAALEDTAHGLRRVNVAVLAREPDAVQSLDRLSNTLSALERFCNALKQAIADEAAGDGDAPHHPEEHHGDQ